MSTPAFDPKTYLATGGHGRTAARYGAGQIIFSQAGPVDAVFYIRAGNVKLSAVSEQGAEVVVAICGKGEFFGEGCLGAQPLCSTTASAVGDCEVIRVEKAEMARVLRAEPALATFFIAYLLQRNTHIEADLADQLLN